MKLQLEFIMKEHAAVRRDRESGKGGGVAAFTQNESLGFTHEHRS